MDNSSMTVRNIPGRQAILDFVVIITLVLSMSEVSMAQRAKLVPLFSITGVDMDVELNQPSDVFIDEKHHEIYVADAGNNRIVVFDMDGFSRYQFATPRDSGILDGLVVNDRGEILLIIGGKVAVCDFRGGLLEYVDFYKSLGSEKINATRLKIDKRSNYYVLDAAGRRVLSFDSDWNFRFAIDSGSFPRIVKDVTHVKEQDKSVERPLNIGDICVDDEGKIYIVDYMASYVFVFGSEGKYQRSMGEPGSAFNTLSFPSGVAVDDQERVLVVDTTGHGLLGYDKEGKLLFALGGLGRSTGKFYFPKYVSTDRSGRIYVVEPFLNRIQVLNVEYLPAVAEDSSPFTGQD